MTLTDDTATLNLRWCYALLDGLVAAGVSELVISPGSRSTPLVLAARQHRGLRLWTQVDERCAAFFALGMSVRSARPVAVLATSGSAPAHWFPALVEASQRAASLVFISADRPPELQDCGANQTIDQQHLFGKQVRAFHNLEPAEADPARVNWVRHLGARAGHDSMMPVPGPVHINVQLREPLVVLGAVPLPDFSEAVGPPQGFPAPIADAEVERLMAIMSARPGLIVCGPDRHDPQLGPAVMALAQALDCPVLADPLSNLRFGSHHGTHISAAYDLYLRDGAFRATRCPDWVLRIGAMPVSKVLGEYLSQCGARDVILVERHGRNLDPIHTVSERVYADPAQLCSSLLARQPLPAPVSWRRGFAWAERAATAHLGANGLPEAALIRALVSKLPAHSLLFCANSTAIRDLDLFCGGGGKALHIVANRGVSGIDGNVSTALGLAAAHPGDGKVVALLGDLALYHDMNGLLATRQAPPLLLVVVNNGGGAIFGQLPHAQLDGFEQHWLTPPDLDVADVARLYRLPQLRVAGDAGVQAALEEALQWPQTGILEVVVERERGVRLRHDWLAGFEVGVD